MIIIKKNLFVFLYYKIHILYQNVNSNISFYTCFTKNFISETGCEGYGYNYVIYNKTARLGVIKFTSKIENVSSNKNDFSFRYNITEVFKQFGLSLSNTVKISNGTWQCYNTEGKILLNLMNYGSSIRQENGMVKLGRYYTNDGRFGAWSASEFLKGWYLNGEFVIYI